MVKLNYIILSLKSFAWAILLVALMLIFIGSDNSELEKTTIKKQPQLSAELKQQLKIKSVVNASQHTNLVGSIDHPTIDGGIINAADGIPVNSSSEIMLKTINQKENSFQDDWATSEKVKKMLQNAATDGKLNYVLQKAEEKGLPASVATIPMIESNYQNDAVSPKGAAGVWQLMPKTAKDSGLDPEERKELIPSTDAAINLLAHLHEQFGSWELAFAAYNAGPEKVKAALKKNPEAKSINDLDLPQETKDYVAKIMAVNQAIEKIEKAK